VKTGAPHDLQLRIRRSADRKPSFSENVSHRAGNRPIEWDAAAPEGDETNQARNQWLHNGSIGRGGVAVGVFRFKVSGSRFFSAPDLKSLRMAFRVFDARSSVARRHLFASGGGRHLVEVDAGRVFRSVIRGSGRMKVFPFLVIGTTVVCLVAERRSWVTLARCCGVPLPAFWLAATIAGGGDLFRSAPRRILPPALAGTAFCGSPVRLALSTKSGGKATHHCSMPYGPHLSQRESSWRSAGPDPETRPAGGALPELEGAGDGVSREACRSEARSSIPTPECCRSIWRPPEIRPVRRSTSDDVSHPRRVNIGVEPLLNVREPLSRSVLDDSGATAAFRTCCRDGSPAGRSTIWHVGRAVIGSDSESSLRVAATARRTRRRRRSRHGAAGSGLLAPQFLRPLSRFTAIAGCRCRFSPCPDERVEIRPADYPLGRPGRWRIRRQQRPLPCGRSDVG